MVTNVIRKSYYTNLLFAISYCINPLCTISYWMSHLPGIFYWITCRITFFNFDRPTPCFTYIPTRSFTKLFSCSPSHPPTQSMLIDIVPPTIYPVYHVYHKYFLVWFACITAKWESWANVGLMLGQRRRRWSSFKPALCQCLASEMLSFISWLNHFYSEWNVCLNIPFANV